MNTEKRAKFKILYGKSYNEIDSIYKMICDKTLQIYDKDPNKLLTALSCFDKLYTLEDDSIIFNLTYTNIFPQESINMYICVKYINDLLGEIDASYDEKTTNPVPAIIGEIVEFLITLNMLVTSSRDVSPIYAGLINNYRSLVNKYIQLFI